MQTSNVDEVQVLLDTTPDFFLTNHPFISNDYVLSYSHVSSRDISHPVVSLLTTTLLLSSCIQDQSLPDREWMTTWLTLLLFHTFLNTCRHSSWYYKHCGSNYTTPFTLSRHCFGHNETSRRQLSLFVSRADDSSSSNQSCRQRKPKRYFFMSYVVIMSLWFKPRFNCLEDSLYSWYCRDSNFSLFCITCLER